MVCSLRNVEEIEISGIGRDVAISIGNGLCTDQQRWKKGRPDDDVGLWGPRQAKRILEDTLGG